MKRGAFLAGFLALLAFDTLGQISFKMVADRTAPVVPDSAFVTRLLHEPWVLAIVLAYLGAFAIYMTLVRVAPIGPLFAGSHLEIVTVALAGVFLFGESLGTVQLLGCAAILAGVFLLAVEPDIHAGP